MKTKAFNLFALILLTVAWWFVASFLFGASSLVHLVAWLFIGWIFALIVYFLAKKIGHSGWISFAGLLILAALFLPDRTLIAIADRLPQPLTDPMTMTILLTFPLALIVAALLLHSGLILRQDRGPGGLEDESGSPARPEYNGLASWIPLVLSLLILGRSLYNFYWFMVWDTTGDSLGNFWLFIPLLIVLFCSAILISLLPGKAKLAGAAYLLLIPAFIAVSSRAQGVDFRQLTEARAGRVQQAILAYYTREGRYPQNLQALIPRYALAFPGPLVIYGQNWCYQGGSDYYRLGYLDRPHWSSPILFGHVFASQGQAPVKMDVCQVVIDRYRAQNPGWDETLRIYGQPTPTPDFR